MANLREVSIWAETLIRRYLDPDEWTFAFDRAKRRAGCTHYAKKQITVSRYLAEKWDDADIYQTLLHEIAHAMLEPGAGHSKEWLETARRIGYKGGRTHNGEIAIEHATWKGECPSGHIFHRFRAPHRTTSCRQCSPVFSLEHVVTWSKQQV